MNHELLPFPAQSSDLQPLIEKARIAVHRLRVHGTLVRRTGALASVCGPLFALNLQRA